MACSGCGNVLNKVSNIIEGTTKFIFNIDSDDTIIKDRLTMCSNCPNKNPLVKIGNSTLYNCNLCKCIIQSKVRVKEEHCPINKW